MQSCDQLVRASAATQQDGWIAVSNTNNLLVMKKPSKKGESTVNCIKGSGIINAPPEFVFRILRNQENNCILDDLLKETRIIDRMTSCSVLVHLIYKAVLPTAPRDFTAISTAGQYDETTLVEAGISVVDERIPEMKGYVRGNIICGGYVVKTCPGNPEQCQVTYVSQAELKGSIPTFAVNKVTESQPQCISRLRTLAEKRYAELRGDPKRMREFEEAIALNPIRAQSSSLEEVPASPSRSPSATGQKSLSSESKEISAEEREKAIHRAEKGEDSGGGERRKEKASVNSSHLATVLSQLPSESAQSSHEDENEEMWTVLSAPPPHSTALKGRVGTEEGEGEGGGEEGEGGRTDEDELLVTEVLETYTPEEIASDEEHEAIDKTLIYGKHSCSVV